MVADSLAPLPFNNNNNNNNNSSLESWVPARRTYNLHYTDQERRYPEQKFLCMLQFPHTFDADELSYFNEFLGYFWDNF